jgi:hypothetical protein
MSARLLMDYMSWVGPVAHAAPTPSKRLRKAIGMAWKNKALTRCPRFKRLRRDTRLWTCNIELDVMGAEATVIAAV